MEDFILVKHFRENITGAATPGTNHLAIGLRSRDTIDHSSAAHRSDGGNNDRGGGTKRGAYFRLEFADADLFANLDFGFHANIDEGERVPPVAMSSCLALQFCSR